MVAPQDHESYALPPRVQATRQASADWFKRHGEQSLIALGTVFMWGAAAHATYLAAVPEPLRVSVAKRNQRVWKGLALGSLAAVALYDSVHSALLTEQQRQLTADAQRIRAQILQMSSKV